MPVSAISWGQPGVSPQGDEVWDERAEKIQILLVDEDYQWREGIKVYLQVAGFEVVGVGDFESFEVALAEEVPHLAVVDFRLPPKKSDAAEDLGFKVQDRCRQAGVPVLGMAFERCPVRITEEGREGFGDDFISQNQESFLKELLAAVRRMLGEEAGGD